MRRQQLITIGLYLMSVFFSNEMFGVTSPEKILHQFLGNADGCQPYGGLVFDTSGSLYGTTAQGGSNGAGTVFEMTPTQNGWNYNVLYSFQNTGGDGVGPFGSLAFDTAGNLYGTTLNGGAFGQGTVFQLSPSGGGEWTESILYSFGAQEGDGSGAISSVVFDAAGSLYGVTEAGGIAANQCPSNGCGTVFQLSPTPSGLWTETVLYRFQGGSDGAQPQGGVTLDAAGNLYGTTVFGGESAQCKNPYPGCGTVFEVSPSQRGWIETIAYSFQGKHDGAFPYANVILDSAGNLYSTARGGGAYGLSPCEDVYLGGCGVVFELSPNQQGSWTYTSLHLFRGRTNGSIDGGVPLAGLVLDNSGRVYGTTLTGGFANLGTVYRLTAGQDGKWTEERFAFPNQAHGNSPTASVTLDVAGNVYGTTENGDQVRCGVVFQLIPPE